MLFVYIFIGYLTWKIMSDQRKATENVNKTMSDFRRSKVWKG